MSTSDQKFIAAINNISVKYKTDVVRIMRENGYKNIDENMSSETIRNRLVSAMASDINLAQNIVDFMTVISRTKSFAELAASGAITAGLSALGTLGTAWSTASQARQNRLAEEARQKQATNRMILIASASFMVLFVGAMIWMQISMRKMALKR